MSADRPSPAPGADCRCGPEATDLQLARLKDRLSALAPGVVAVSGGLDSRLLAHLAWKWNLPFAPVHLTGPHVAPTETAQAVDWIRRQGRDPILIAVDPLEVPAVRTTARDRCYHCKRLLFAAVGRAAASLGAATVIEGSHADDLRAHEAGRRPGMTALRELGVHSPLADAGLTKAQLRLLARRTGLEQPDQPSRPCLLTRLDYGLTADPTVLAALARVEKRLAAMGFADFRLRLHADGRTVLQVAAEGERPRAVPGAAPDLQQALELVRSHGFAAVELLLGPCVSGYFDR